MRRPTLLPRRVLVVVLSGFLATVAGPARAASDGVLEGSVRTSDGLALPHVGVLVEGPSGTLQVTTDPEGCYRVAGLAAGEYTASVDAPGFVLDGPAQVTVADGGTPARLDLVLSPAPVREHVLVTAARGEALHSNLGVSTSLLDRERIEERAAPSLLPLLQEVPGTATARTGAIGQQGSVFLRGGEARYAAVLVDGVPVNQPGGAFDWSAALPFELERVEVVRGAASSLYGNDALAGVIQLVTRRARDGEAPRCAARRRRAASTGSATRRRPPAPGGASTGTLGVQRLTTDNAEPNSRFEQTAVAASLGFRFGPQTRGAGRRPLRRRRRRDRRAHGLRPPRSRRVVRAEGRRGRRPRCATPPGGPPTSSASATRAPTSSR